MEPFTLIEGPEAWKAADYQGRTDWINHLSEQHICELDAAISGVIAKGIKDRDIHVSCGGCVAVCVGSSCAVPHCCWVWVLWAGGTKRACMGDGAAPASCVVLSDQSNHGW